MSLGDELSEVLHELVGAHHVPGVVAGVLVDRQPHVAAVGVTSVEDPHPLGPATQFQIGSVSKTFTSAATALLVEDGRLAWDDPLSLHLPDLAARLRPAIDLDAVTVELALSHRSGFDGDHLFVTLEGDDLGALAGARPLFAPGDGYSYSNAGFSLVGEVIARVEGRPFHRVVAERLLGPLGLEGACYCADDAITRPLALPHWVLGEDAYVLRGGGWQPGWELSPVDRAAGGLVASVSHLLEWGRSQLDGASADGTPLLSSESLARLHTPVVEADALYAVGIDWFVRDIDGVTTIGHGGLTAGYCTNLRIVPERDVVLAVCTHATNGGPVNHEVTRWALERAADLVLRDPVPHAAAAPEARWAEGRYLGPFGEHEVVAGDEPGTVVIDTVARTDVAWQPPADAPVTLAFHSAVDAVSTAGADPARLARFGPTDGDRAEWVLWGDRRCVRIA